MFKDALIKLEAISKAVGNRPDYIQGGGGNTSVKLNDELMAIKASGYRLSQITPEDGFVVLNYKNIKNYYENIDINPGIDYEKESSNFIRGNIFRMEGMKELRPSVEAGFHSVLKNCVIHSHSVYSNIICCSKNGAELADRIFAPTGYAYLWIPYVRPGFNLTLKIMDGIERCIGKGGRFPDFVLMENHGLIVCSEEYKACIELHTRVNALIRKFLGINESYPEIRLNKIDETVFMSDTRYLVDFFKESLINTEYFYEVVLYPDQIVYLNDNISINGPDNKLNINTSTGEIIYNAGYQEALALEEVLLAYIYIVNMVKENGFELKTMPAGEIDFIKNWEGEKYRKSLLKNAEMRK